MKRSFIFTLFCVLFTIFSSAYPENDAPIYAIMKNDQITLTNWLDIHPETINKAFIFNISENRLHGLFYGTLLHCAVIMNNPEIIRMLIEKGASVNAKGLFNIAPKKMYTLFDFARIYEAKEAEEELTLHLQPS